MQLVFDQYAVKLALGKQDKAHQAAQWLRDNRVAIEGYNAEVERIGVFGDSWRGQTE